MQKITPFLWFDKEAGEAAKFYSKVFKKSKILDKTVMEGTPSGTVEIINMELFGQEFTLMSAGPYFKFNEAISFVVDCKDQKEVDYYWNKLSEGGHKSQCGWLKDKFGVSWQIVPKGLNKYLGGKNKEGRERATAAMLQMSKLEIRKIKEAYEGK